MHRSKRKGIILAGGSGSRLHPLTQAISKQLLPVYDKPLIYYPLSTLMLAGITEVLIITTPQDNELFKRQLGTGDQWGMSFAYAVQPEPTGLADAYRIGRDFLNGSPSVLILGDNILYGHGLVDMLQSADQGIGATLFCSHVRDPRQFGVVEMDANRQVLSVEEKPLSPRSNWAITGLYFMDEQACDFADKVVPSARGEIEITSVLEMYLNKEQLNAQTLYRGFAWLDAGTHESLQQAGELVRTLQDRQGLLVASPDEIAFRQGHITSDQLRLRAELFGKSSYGIALNEILVEETRSNG